MNGREQGLVASSRKKNTAIASDSQQSESMEGNPSVEEGNPSGTRRSPRKLPHLNYYGGASSSKSSDVVLPPGKLDKNKKAQLKAMSDLSTKVNKMKEQGTGPMDEWTWDAGDGELPAPPHGVKIRMKINLNTIREVVGGK